MTRMELLNRIVDNHNRVANVEVHGESTILVADTLRDLRNLIQVLQNGPIQEEEDKGEN